MVTKKPTPAAQVAAMAKLIPVMRDEYQKLGSLIDEFEAIAGGGPTIGEKLRELEAHYSDLWQVRYGSPYTWTDFKLTRGQWKTLLRKLSIDALKDRVANYIRNSEPFYADKRHPFGMFVATVNQHVGDRSSMQTLAEPPTGCKHDPPCADQFAHTRRRQAEQTQ